MMMKNKSFMWLGILAFLAASCLLTSSTASAADRTEIRVGAPLSMTGGGTMPAMEQKWAYETAVADINKKGGVFVKELNKKLPIKLIMADDKSLPDGAAFAMERLIKRDKIDLCLSSDTTPKNLAAATIAEIYRQRWQIELFFKWIKQHLKIKSFYGTSANAVKTQIWIAISTYLLIAIARKELAIPVQISLHTFLHILEVNLFEQRPIKQIVMDSLQQKQEPQDSIQLNLFDF